jgi:Putative citrate transport
LENPGLFVFDPPLPAQAVFGAAAGIGNGPNFMVEAVADQWKIRRPTVSGFVSKFTPPFRLPMLPAIRLIFLRG